MTTGAILDQGQQLEMAYLDQRRWEAVVGRDATHDGEFVFAVTSTGVYCRPSCPAKRPRRENVEFFRQPDEAEKAGYRACLRCRPRAINGNRQLEMVKAVCRYIEQHLEEPLTLGKLAAAFHRSPFHLQRTFTSAPAVTPRAYADSCRLTSLKRNLQAGHNVTRAMYDAGYSSSSRLYERTASQLGMTPDKYRRGAIAASIRYACADSPLGRMLIAATDKGICSIQFGRSDSELLEGLKREFPFAVRKEDEGGLHSWASALLKHMAGKNLDASLPLDIRATAFQRQVWTYLQSIPFGQTKSYSEVAQAIGRPSACRAVARACATVAGIYRSILPNLPPISRIDCKQNFLGMSVRGTLCARTVEGFTLGELLSFGEVEIAILQRHHIKQTGVRIVRRRKPIGSANDAGTDRRAFCAGKFPGRQGTARSIDSVGPGDFFKKGRRPQEFAIASVQNIEKAIWVRLQQQVTCASIFFDVHQHGRLIGIVVIDVVRSELEIPFQLAAGGIDGENACRIKIVAGS